MKNTLLVKLICLWFIFFVTSLCSASQSVVADQSDQQRGEKGMNSEAHSPQANHLIHEKSPYLQQHVYNPVDWYPWGDEALAKAKQENKPIFLSIGYSTCHWCHVMAHESFEDQEIADYLNSHFVSIKVDREERPGLDQIYMAATQAMTGSGGGQCLSFSFRIRNPFMQGPTSPLVQPLEDQGSWKFSRQYTGHGSLTERVSACLPSR
jgi:thioredoxin-related protein